MKTKKVLFVVAHEGYQPVEYNDPKKIIEDAGFQVVTASNKPGTATATDGSTTSVDIMLDNVNVNDYDGIIFIGGSGTLDSLDNETSYQLLQKAEKNYKVIGAICIATRILAKAKIMNRKKATGWNGDDALASIYEHYNVSYLPEINVVTDDMTITATDPKAAKDFGHEIVDLLERT
ncbi:MAG: DJ-1/PfpI family protein [Candidatus Babeliales bacterium]|jgi:deglycase